MKKLLRYSLTMVFALVASVGFAQEATLDFTTNSWGLPEGSAAKIKTAASYTSGKYTINISETTDGHYWNADGYLLMGKTGATLTLPAFDFDVARIEVVGRTGASTATLQNIYVGDEAVSTQTKGADKTQEYAIKPAHQAKGTIYSIKVNSKHNTQIVKINVYKVGSEGETPQPPVEITYTDVASVKDLLANYKEDTKNLNLTLTNAKVTFVNEYNGTINTYVREGDTAIELRTLGFNMPVNSILNGKVKVDLKFNYGVPYLAANAGTDDESITVTESTEAAQPIEATVADIIANKYLNDLVTIKGFTFSKEEYQEGRFNYYANDGEQKIMIYDKFNKVGGVAELTEGEKYTVTGLYGAIFKGTPEILPTQKVTAGTPTGINNITTSAADNAPIFNLAGQKVGKSYKGVVIKAGKKMIQ